MPVAMVNGQDMSGSYFIDIHRPSAQKLHLELGPLPSQICPQASGLSVGNPAEQAEVQQKSAAAQQTVLTTSFLPVTNNSDPKINQFSGL